MKAFEESTFLLTSGACPNLWRTYGYDSSIEYIWRSSDLVERLIFVALALMLVYTVFVVTRFFRCYYSVQRESLALLTDSTGTSQTRQKRLASALSRGVGTLKAMASAAPFLGLAGTCYGIVGGFHCLGMRAHGGIGSIWADIAGTLVTTLAGLIVAIPAAVSYNALRMRLEKFESTRSSVLLEARADSFQVAQTLPLRGRFSALPAFALIAAPVVALLIPMFALMLRSPIPVGLQVRLLKVGMSDHDSSAIVVSVVGGSTRTPRAVYVNSMETPWSELDNAIRNQLRTRPHWAVDVEGGDDVPWEWVADAIDVAHGLHAEVVLLTGAPRIDRSHLPEAKTKRAGHQ
jgi:biopolymer transport protein ExbB